MNTVNMVVDDEFRKRSDLMLELLNRTGMNYEINQMKLALEAESDVIVKLFYPDKTKRLLKLMEEYNLIKLTKSYESRIWVESRSRKVEIS